MCGSIQAAGKSFRPLNADGDAAARRLYLQIKSRALAGAAWRLKKRQLIAGREFSA
jgi:hypothetical protein